MVDVPEPRASASSAEGSSPPKSSHPAGGAEANGAGKSSSPPPPRPSSSSTSVEQYSCVSCGDPGASFSKTQKKKVASKRRCSACVEKERRKPEEERKRRARQGEPSIENGTRSGGPAVRKKPAQTSDGGGKDDGGDVVRDEEASPTKKTEAPTPTVVEVVVSVDGGKESENGAVEPAMTRDGGPAGDDDGQNNDDGGRGDANSKGEEGAPEIANEAAADAGTPSPPPQSEPPSSAPECFDSTDADIGAERATAIAPDVSEADDSGKAGSGRVAEENSEDSCKGSRVRKRTRDDGNESDGGDEDTDTPPPKDKQAATAEEEDEEEVAGSFSPLQPSPSDDDEGEEEGNVVDDRDDNGVGGRNERRPKRPLRRETYREKMKRARNESMLLDADDGEGTATRHDADGGGRGRGGVSLEAIKLKVLGRSVPSMYDRSAEDGDRRNDRSPPATKEKPPALSDGASVANHLRGELSCPICRDPLYRPVSLSCGHSFCQGCLGWWSERSSGDDGNDGEGDGRCRRGGGTCPTCRAPFRPSSSSSPAGGGGPPPPRATNTALQAVVTALYPKETALRRTAEEREERKAVAGEAGGYHKGGCRVLVPLPSDDDEGESGGTDGEGGWTVIPAADDSEVTSAGRPHRRGGCRGVSVRRNIVMDDHDQRFQLSMGLTGCAYSPGKGAKGCSKSGQGKGGGAADGAMDLRLCLLSMEEDEVDDSGFPSFVATGSDDERLVCTDRDRIHSCVEASARVEFVVGGSGAVSGDAPPTSAEAAEGGDDAEESSPAAESTVVVLTVPLSRGTLGDDGTVRFRIDLRRAADRAAENATSGGGTGGTGDAHRSPVAAGVVKVLRFRHVDTGALLELRPPSFSEGDDNDKEGDGAGGVEFGAVDNSRIQQRQEGPAKFFMGDEDDGSDSEGENEYREDDFLVGNDDDDDSDSENSDVDDEKVKKDGKRDPSRGAKEDSADHEDSDEDHDFQDDEDEDAEEEEGDGTGDECEVCGMYGELIVCDGGEYSAGCGRSYHVSCIGRREVPPGDWICQQCANDRGMDDVGFEGHEWKEGGDGHADEEEEEEEDAMEVYGEDDDEVTFDRTDSAGDEEFPLPDRHVAYPNRPDDSDDDCFECTTPGMSNRSVSVGDCDGSNDAEEEGEDDVVVQKWSSDDGGDSSSDEDIMPVRNKTRQRKIIDDD